MPRKNLVKILKINRKRKKKNSKSKLEKYSSIKLRNKSIQLKNLFQSMLKNKENPTVNLKKLRKNINYFSTISNTMFKMLIKKNKLKKY